MYKREGYFLPSEPVLEVETFMALKAYFEKLLAQLPIEVRPEAMDVPHFIHPELLQWALNPSILGLVEPILGHDLALFSTHFICKPKGNGKRVPWHEDSAYWRGQIEPMNVCTVWLALDSSTKENGCMMVIPRSHIEAQAGFSDYQDINEDKAVFPNEIIKAHRDDARRVYLELEPNHASLHDSRIQHGSEPNVSTLRRCGWALRFCSTASRFNYGRFDGAHQVYLAQGCDIAGNHYADPTRSYPEVMQKRREILRYRHSH